MGQAPGPARNPLVPQSKCNRYDLKHFVGKWQVLSVGLNEREPPVRPDTFTLRSADCEHLRAEIGPDDALVTKTQAVGQQASRELKPGTILSARMLDPVELVKSGQFVTITVSHGGVSIKTVARAMESGSLGQTIKVKNETTKDIFDVVLTGPQQGSLNSDVPRADVAAMN